MSAIEQSQLGHHTHYPTHYDPSLLFAVSRTDNRLQLAPAPLFGSDVWTAYELSWLNLHGLPQVAIAEFSIPAASPNLIESKSFKLYLNSLNAHKFSDSHAMMTQVTHDLSGCAGAMVTMKLHAVNNLALGTLTGQNLDQLTVAIDTYTPNRNLLVIDEHLSGDGCWHSHLLKSNCPVTDQPDWGSIVIEMRARKLPKSESLLAYIVSYRDHQGFHEHCVESIYNDLWQVFQPEKLTVYARYVRRGGLDINPWRTSQPHPPTWPTMPRLARQ
jgi:7-cyano-7-deazaguanine reductase